MQTIAQSQARGYYVRGRRQGERDRLEWKRKVGTLPQNLGSVAASGTSAALTVRSNERIMLSPLGFSIAALGITLNYRGRAIKTPAIANGAYFRLPEVFIRARTITFTRSAAAGTGTLRIYIMGEPGSRRFQIATLTYT